MRHDQAQDTEAPGNVILKSVIVSTAHPIITGIYLMQCQPNRNSVELTTHIDLGTLQANEVLLSPSVSAYLCCLMPQVHLGCKHGKVFDTNSPHIVSTAVKCAEFFFLQLLRLTQFGGAKTIIWVLYSYSLCFIGVQHSLILIILAYCSVFATFHLPNCTG